MPITELGNRKSFKISSRACLYKRGILNRGPVLAGMPEQGSRGARSALFDLVRLFCFTSRRIVVNDRHSYLTETAD